MANNNTTEFNVQRRLNNGNKNPTTIAIVQLMLDLAQSTGQQHLELLDAAGNTPVHDAVKYQLPEILSLMLDKGPDLVNHENAVGSTPLEVARDAWIVEITQDVPSSRSIYYNGSRVAHGLMNRGPESFVAG